MRPLGLVEGLFVRGLEVPHLHTSSSPSRRYLVEGLRCRSALTCGHGPGRNPLSARAPVALEVTLTFVTEARSELRHWGAHPPPRRKGTKALGREAQPCDDECGPDRRVCSYRPQFLFDFWQPSGVDGHDHVSFVVFMPFPKAGEKSSFTAF